MHLLKSLAQSNTDIRLLWVSSAVRRASYGVTNQILTLYLSLLNVSDVQIGYFMTLTLVGDTLLSYWLTWNADTIGRRRVMAIGALLMICSGVVFATSSNFYVLLIAAIVGVISPSGDESGPFKAVEEAAIAHLTPLNHRPEIYAFHGMFSTAGSALGSLACGFSVDLLSERYELEFCYRLAFWVYSAIGIAKLAIAFMLSEKCESSYITEGEQMLLDESGENDEDTKHQTLTGLAPETQTRLLKLLGTFMLDSFGYGFMPSAWVVYYFRKIFEVSASFLGSLFFITDFFTSISSLPSAYMAKTFGPVKSTLMGQIPSALFYMLVGSTSNRWIASVCLVFYSSTLTIDVVPRQILLTTLFNKHELTRVLGIVNIGKTFARCVGPIFTGRLADINRLYMGFFITGICWLGADGLLWYNFYGIDKHVLLAQSVEHVIE